MLASSALRLDGGPFRHGIMEPERRLRPVKPKRSAERLAEIAIFAGLCLILAVLFVATAPSMLDDRETWNDGLIALSIAQAAILGGAGLKFYWLIEGNRKVLLRFARSTGHLQTGVRVDDVVQIPSMLPPALNNEITNVALLGGRKYVAFADGSIEIDTLLGRRRFTSLDAAREFVGD